MKPADFAKHLINLEPFSSSCRSASPLEERAILSFATKDYLDAATAVEELVSKSSGQDQFKYQRLANYVFKQGLEYYQEQDDILNFARCESAVGKDSDHSYALAINEAIDDSPRKAAKVAKEAGAHDIKWQQYETYILNQLDDSPLKDLSDLYKEAKPLIRKLYSSINCH